MPLVHTDNSAQLHVSWLAGLTNAAGGWPYHLTALRYRRALWTPYRLAVAELLRAWAPLETELVLVGPSAGWNLDAGFLSRFEVVYAIEPDPLARWLLRRRFPRVRWVMTARDYLSPQGPAGWTANLAQLFADFPDQALLFFGVLGQLIVLHPEAVAAEDGQEVIATAAFRHWKAALRGHLGLRSWCSVHDRWVGHQPPLAQALAADGATFLPAAPDPGQLWPAGAVVADVLMDELVPNGAKQLLLWRRLPDRWHVMEAAWARQPLRRNP